MDTLPRIKQIALGVVVLIIRYSRVSLFGLWIGCVILYHVFKKGLKVLENKQRKRPACLDDPSLGEHGIVELRDVKIHYVANGSKDKPLMLCLHGFPEFWYSWRHQLREFASDYRVVAIDLRGYGESDKPKKISSYRVPHIIEDINQLLPAVNPLKREFRRCQQFHFLVKVPENWSNTTLRLVVDSSAPAMNGTSFHISALLQPGQLFCILGFVPIVILCMMGLPNAPLQWPLQMGVTYSDFLSANQAFANNQNDPLPQYWHASVAYNSNDIGYQSCILMGHDWGGAIAWGVAMTYPKLVDKLIILDAPHPETFGEYAMKNRSQVSKSWYMALFQVPRIPEMSLTLDDMKYLRDLFTSKESGVRSKSMTSEDLEAYVYNFSPPRSFTSPINYYRAMFLPNILRQFGFVKSPEKKRNLSTKVRAPIPTVVIWGVHDSVLEAGLAEATKRHVDGVTVRYVEDAGHFVQIDQPDKVNEHIRLFLDENKHKANDDDSVSEIETETKAEADIKLDMENEAETKNEPSMEQPNPEKLVSRTEPSDTQPTERVLEPSIDVKFEPKIERRVETITPAQTETDMEAEVEQNFEIIPDAKVVQVSVPGTPEPEIEASTETESEKTTG